jgi:tetrahydromethanopterin S-methyltransferase subunit G
MAAENFLHVVEGGDHSLIVAKKQLQAANERQDEIDRRVVAVIEEFVGRA